MNPDSDLYKFVQKAVGIRKDNKVWNYPHIERWCDDSFYAFTRGQLLLAVTNNDQGSQHRDISYHPYKPGQKLCNQFYEGDCVVVTADNKVPVTLNNGEAKFYLPVASAEDEVLA